MTQRGDSGRIVRTIEPVVQDTEGQTVGLVSAVPAHQTRGEDLAGLVERSVVKIDNAEVLANHLSPLGLGGELHGESAVGRVLLVGRADAGLHDVVEVVVAELGGGVGRMVGFRHGAVLLGLLGLSLLGLVVVRLIVGITNDGCLGVGSAIANSSVFSVFAEIRLRKSTYTSAGGSHLSRWL